MQKSGEIKSGSSIKLLITCSQRRDKFFSSQGFRQKLLHSDFRVIFQVEVTGLQIKQSLEMAVQFEYPKIR